MNLTYNKILAGMKDEFFKLTGISPDNAGDLGVRLKVLAGELYSLSCYGDFILKQAFPQTATNEYLDMQSNQRGIFRKTSSKASGILTFSLKEAIENDVEVPLGTICSSSENPRLSFATTQKGLIKAGSLTADAVAESIGDGEEYNVKSGEISVMVTPPASVFSVINNEKFAGGCDSETDEALRDRLMESVINFPNGFNTQSYAERIETLDYVLDASVINAWDNETGTCLIAYVRTKSGRLTSSNISEIESLFMESIIAGYEISVEEATNVDINFRVNVFADKGQDEDEIKRQVEKIVKKFFDKRNIGESVSLIKLSRELSTVDGIKNFDFDNYDNRLFITTGMDAYIKLASLEVNIND